MREAQSRGLDKMPPEKATAAMGALEIDAASCARPSSLCVESIRREDRRKAFARGRNRQQQPLTANAVARCGLLARCGAEMIAEPCLTSRCPEDAADFSNQTTNIILANARFAEPINQPEIETANGDVIK